MRTNTGKGLSIMLVTGLLFTLILVQNTHAIVTTVGSGHIVINADLDDTGPTIIERKIYTIQNMNGFPVSIEILPIGEIQSMTTVIDNGFTLQPNEIKDARFQIEVSKPGKYEGKLQVRFTPVYGSPEQTGAGIGIKITLIAKGEGYIDPDETTTTSTTTTIEATETTNSESTIETETQSPTTTIKATEKINTTKVKPSLTVGIIVIASLIIISLAVYSIVKLTKS